MCVPTLCVCHTATKSRSPPMCQHLPERSWKVEEDDACSGCSKDYLRAWGRRPKQPSKHCWKQGPKGHHKKTKALWLHLCLASWGCNLHPVCLFLPSTQKSCPAIKASFPVSLHWGEQLSSPWQLLSDDTGAEGSSDCGGCISLCCCSINSLIVKARSYPVTALSVVSGWTVGVPTLCSHLLCSWMLRKMELSSTALSLLCPWRLLG